MVAPRLSVRLGRERSRRRGGMEGALFGGVRHARRCSRRRRHSGRGRWERRRRGGRVGAVLGRDAVLPAWSHPPAGQAGPTQFVRVGSAAVQGSAAELEESPSRSRQRRTRRRRAPESERSSPSPDQPRVLYRPTSMPGPGRRSPAAWPGTCGRDGCSCRPAIHRCPVALFDNVADAIVFVASLERSSPVLLHRWQGIEPSSRSPAPSITPRQSARSPRRLAPRNGSCAYSCTTADRCRDGFAASRCSRTGPRQRSASTLGFEPRDRSLGSSSWATRSATSRRVRSQALARPRHADRRPARAIATVRRGPPPRATTRPTAPDASSSSGSTRPSATP